MCDSCQRTFHMLWQQIEFFSPKVQMPYPYYFMCSILIVECFPSFSRRWYFALILSPSESGGSPSYGSSLKKLSAPVNKAIAPSCRGNNIFSVDELKVLTEMLGREQIRQDGVFATFSGSTSPLPYRCGAFSLFVCFSNRDCDTCSRYKTKDLLTRVLSSHERVK